MNNCKKNFGSIHKSGILLPVSSLPSPYGIGSCGRSAFDFIDFLDECGQTFWQILPLNPTAYGDSPYQSPASLMGNPYFIDLDILAKEGLLSIADLAESRFDGEKVDYGLLFKTRYHVLRRAYSKVEPREEHLEFYRAEGEALEDYALFMALKVQNDYKPWTEWGEYRLISNARADRDRFEDECGFWRWVQYEFHKQWRAVLDYAHEKGITVIGDMPIYVAHDSVEVWRAPEQFLLDENFHPLSVAGCPPDAYAESGQKWGNPIYNWARMANEGYVWWIDRIRKSLSMYDILRIDHFRGFESYYAIPAKADAKCGRWERGPGRALFDAVSAAIPDARIIAEDLGFITDDVRRLLSDAELPGMKVIQFAFYEEGSEHLPRNFDTDNCAVYTGSHDSACTRSWYEGLDGEAKRRFADNCPIKRGRTPTDAAIELAMRSRANLAVIPMQDYLELTDEEGRMNTPSTAGGNWTWRLPRDYKTDRLIKKILRLTRSGRRMKRAGESC